jgi:hypothetical protein
VLLCIKKSEVAGIHMEVCGRIYKMVGPVLGFLWGDCPRCATADMAGEWGRV